VGDDDLCESKGRRKLKVLSEKRKEERRKEKKNSNTHKRGKS
jgi:hypothetical protein